jgi:hypothetical protein
MILDEKTRQRVRNFAAVLDAVPDGEFVSITEYGPVFSTVSQKELRRVRAFFPSVIWDKSYAEWCKTWFYHTIWQGVEITIGCIENPPTCKRIETKTMVVKKVPVAFEEQEVEEIKVSWDCNGGAE